jgi:hypothetical protein
MECHFKRENNRKEEMSFSMKKKIFSLLVVLCLFTSFTTSAFAVERPKDRPSKQELMKAANELEYVFTNIIVQDESTGEYTINEHEIYICHDLWSYSC